MNNVFQRRMKYALTPNNTKANVNAAHNTIPQNGRCRSPTNSDAITNMRTPVPGVKKPTMILVVRNNQKLGENTLKKPTTITTPSDGKRTFERPYLKRNRKCMKTTGSITLFSSSKEINLHYKYKIIGSALKLSNFDK